MGNGEDPKAPGEQLGSFRVDATLDSSSCGVGALGSTEHWEFDVKLSRDGDALYWLNGKEAIVGSMQDELSFEFDTHVAVPAIPPGKGQIGCTVSRGDRAEGKLSSAEQASEFQGKLEYTFNPMEGSDCTPLIGVEGGFSTLPCEMSYLMKATRTAAPATGN